MASTSAGIQAVKSTSAIFGAVVLAGASSPSFAQADTQVANERERLEFIKEQGCKNVKAQALNLENSSLFAALGYACQAIYDNEFLQKSRLSPEYQASKLFLEQLETALSTWQGRVDDAYGLFLHYDHHGVDAAAKRVLNTVDGIKLQISDQLDSGFSQQELDELRHYHQWNSVKLNL